MSRDWDSDPVVVTVAPCGAEVTREQNPAVPYTPQEIARDVVAAAAKGATIAHLHARKADGTPTHERETFRQIIQLIRADTDAICNLSTGGAVGMTIDERIECLDAGAEMAGVETGSLNFAGAPFVTSGSDTQRVIDRAATLGIALEAECFDLGHVAEAARLQAKAVNLRLFNLVLGVPGGAPATPEALQAMIAGLPHGVRWSVTAVGRHQKRMLSLALLLGTAGIRVGFEDNVYIARGRPASSNAELVADVVAQARSLGREVATIGETRRLLGLEHERIAV